MPVSAAFKRAPIHGKWGEKAKPFSHKLAFVTRLYRHTFFKKSEAVWPFKNFLTFWVREKEEIYFVWFLTPTFASCNIHYANISLIIIFPSQKKCWWPLVAKHPLFSFDFSICLCYCFLPIKFHYYTAEEHFMRKSDKRIRVMIMDLSPQLSIKRPCRNYRFRMTNKSVVFILTIWVLQRIQLSVHRIQLDSCRLQKQPSVPWMTWFPSLPPSCLVPRKLSPMTHVLFPGILRHLLLSSFWYKQMQNIWSETGSSFTKECTRKQYVGCQKMSQCFVHFFLRSNDPNNLLACFF